MAQRNLTSQFKTLRDAFSSRRRPRHTLPNLAAAGRDLESQNFENSQLSPIIPNLPPYWVDSVDEVKRLMSDIKDKIYKLNHFHKNRLLVRFDDSENMQDREIDKITVEITGMFREAEQIIKNKVTAFDAGVEQRGIGKSKENVMRENIKKQLAIDLQGLSTQFRTSQKEYMNQLKAQKHGNEDLNQMLGLTSNTRNSALEYLDNDKGQQALLLENVNAGFDYELEQSVFERDAEIIKIAESINELATIFKDLGNLVIDQGTILDRIDYNLENVQIKTEKGLKELDKANKYSENSRPFKCIMILIAIIAVEALFLILKHT